MKRDGTSLWLMAIIAGLLYLEAAGDPRAWGFEEWRQAGLAAALYAVGKHQSSPLKGKSDAGA